MPAGQTIRDWYCIYESQTLLRKCSCGCKVAITAYKIQVYVLGHITLLTANTGRKACHIITRTSVLTVVVHVLKVRLPMCQIKLHLKVLKHILTKQEQITPLPLSSATKIMQEKIAANLLRLERYLSLKNI